MRLLEDPLKVPEMTYSTNDDFRSANEAAHPDVELVQFREPHKRFLEKLQREITVHGRIFYCELAEVRLAAKRSCQSRPSHPQRTSYSRSPVQTFQCPSQVRRTR